MNSPTAEAVPEAARVISGVTMAQQQSPPKKAPYQDGLTILTRIKPGQTAPLIALLNEIGGDIEGNEYIPFLSLQTVHFARFVVLEESHDAQGRPTPASLVLSTNFDGDAIAHLEELYDQAAAGLNRIYSHCEGYPEGAARTKRGAVDYLYRHNLGYNTLYVGTRGRTVAQIREEAVLRDAIEGYLDAASREPGFAERTPQQIRAGIQEFVRSRPDLAWALQPPPAPRKIWPQSRDVLPFAALAILVLALIGTLILGSWRARLLAIGIPLALFGLWVLVLRWKEKRDEVYPAETDFAHVAKLAQKEDRFVQNQMTSITDMKPGPFRLGTIRLVFWLIDIAGRYIFNKGSLGSIPSIHFARWVLVDDNRRVLFFSNFDGSWENYLGDFIDKAAVGLTAVWSNTYGFPRTRFLIQDGATDEQRFKAYARNSQVVTQVWYTAYKRLSVQNINNNSAIRAGLFAEQTPAETAAWLRRL